MIPSPSVIQEISLACIEHSLNWGLMQRKKSTKQPYSRTDDITVEDIIGQLLCAAIDNRRTIAFNIENILIEKSKDPSDPPTILALEIGLHLSTYASHHLQMPGIRSRFNKIQEELEDFWQEVADRLFDIRIHQLEILWKKHYRFCFLLLINGRLSISEIIKWYGVKGILEGMHCTMLPRTTWISIAGQLLIYIPPFNISKPLETSKRINIIEELSIILPTLPTPWLKPLSSNLDLSPLRLLDSTLIDKNSEKVTNYDSDLLFGIFIFLSILVEANQEAGVRNIQFRNKGTPSDDSVEMIKIARHPIIKYLRWTLTARYLSPELELGITPSVSDKIQAEMDNNNFTIEQQNFIWRWVRREIEFIQKTPSN